MSGRHRKIVVELPDWVYKEPNECVRSVAEDAYIAQALAVADGADTKRSCQAPMSAGKKSLKAFENKHTPTGTRCKAGDRAARKFWEAKVCARKAR